MNQLIMFDSIVERISFFEDFTYQVSSSEMNSKIIGNWEFQGDTILTSNNRFEPPIPENKTAKVSGFYNVQLKRDTLTFDSHSELGGRSFYVKEE